MSLLEEFNNYNYRGGKTDDMVKNIAFAILEDVVRRKGFFDVWCDMDNDLSEKFLEDIIGVARKSIT